MPNVEILVDGQYALSYDIDFSDKQQDYIDAWDKFFELLPFTPTVEYTDLGVTPELGDTWDGEKFISSTNTEFNPIGSANVRWFALIVENIIKWVFIVPNDSENSGLIAALQSDPTFQLGQ